MKTFFRKLGAFLTGVRVWAVNLFVLVLLVYFVGIFVVVLQRLPEQADPSGKVLILRIDGPIVDQQVYPDDIGFPYRMPDDNQVQTRDLVRLIRAAADDERLAGVLIDFGEAGFPGASTASRRSVTSAAAAPASCGTRIGADGINAMAANTPFTLASRRNLTVGPARLAGAALTPI